MWSIRLRFDNFGGNYIRLCHVWRAKVLLPDLLLPTLVPRLRSAASVSRSGVFSSSIICTVDELIKAASATVSIKAVNSDAPTQEENESLPHCPVRPQIPSGALCLQRDGTSGAGADQLRPSTVRAGPLRQTGSDG